MLWNPAKKELGFLKALELDFTLDTELEFESDACSREILFESDIMSCANLLVS